MNLKISKLLETYKVLLAISLELLQFPDMINMNSFKEIWKRTFVRLRACVLAFSRTWTVAFVGEGTNKTLKPVGDLMMYRIVTDQCWTHMSSYWPFTWICFPFCRFTPENWWAKSLGLGKAPSCQTKIFLEVK